MYRSKQQIKRIYAIAFIVGGLFLVCSLMPLRHATRQIEQVNIIHLYETTTQLRILLQRQLAQNFSDSSRPCHHSQLHVAAKRFRCIKKSAITATLRTSDSSHPQARDMADAQGIVARHRGLLRRRFVSRGPLREERLLPSRNNPYVQGQVIYCTVPVPSDEHVSHVPDASLRGRFFEYSQHAPFQCQRLCGAD